MSNRVPGGAERQRPRQARSRATVARILETSALLLDEVGLEGLNTNLIAERASVGMQAIYRYFPNKTAILNALLAEVRSEEREWVGDLTTFAGDGGWRSAVRRSIFRYYDGASTRPSFAALRNAARASLEMQAADREQSLKLEGELALGLTRIGVELPAERMAIVCRTIMESATRMLDVALETAQPEATEIVEELTLMITTYLAQYVPPELS
jgi:AcrR family transcriptional regulator